MNNLMIKERGIQFAPTDVKTILVVGLDNDKFAKLVKYKNGSKKFVFNSIVSHFSAFHGLVNSLENTKNDLPIAIIFDYDLEEENNFSFVKKITSNETLKGLPLIGISDRINYSNAKKALRLGIDDIYPEDLSWKNVTKRIEFLIRFKSEISNTKIIENKEFKLPLGKRIFDIIFAGSALLFLSPFLILVGILIKLESKGPIFYLSKRAGSGYQIFDFIKFRSMRVDADEKLKKLAHLNQYDGVDDADDKQPKFFKLQNDPRVTRVGKLIRKTSIDELPQLINVIKGDMSIVGNRPLPLYEAEQLTNDGWAKRFSAPAGLTGLWQISKRGKKNMSVDERIQLDINYANGYSFWLDLKIISKTLPAMIQDEQV